MKRQEKCILLFLW